MRWCQRSHSDQGGRGSWSQLHREDAWIFKIERSQCCDVEGDQTGNINGCVVETNEFSRML